MEAVSSSLALLEAALSSPRSRYSRQTFDETARRNLMLLNFSIRLPFVCWSSRSFVSATADRATSNSVLPGLTPTLESSRELRKLPKFGR